MDSSKVLRRTPAGDSEVAVPASGLSITQRRILTLLDTPARLDDLAVGQALDPERLCREALRLARGAHRIRRPGHGRCSAAQGSRDRRSTRRAATGAQSRLGAVGDCRGRSRLDRMAVRWATRSVGGKPHRANGKTSRPGSRCPGRLTGSRRHSDARPARRDTRAKPRRAQGNARAAGSKTRGAGDPSGHRAWKRERSFVGRRCSHGNEWRNPGRRNEARCNHGVDARAGA